MDKSTTEKSVTLEKLLSLCKRRGFVYQSSEIYGGLNGVYDFGPLGSLLKNNIKHLWLKAVQTYTETVLLLDGAILGSPRVWEASGHVQHFHDPMVDCLNCKKRYRTDDIDITKSCPACGTLAWTETRQFNMMFSTDLGAAENRSTRAYLRPETAQTIFVNFKNVLSSSPVKIPFGIAQIGKAFRNEITPKQFLFRMREFEQMELEWFCKEADAPYYFNLWCDRRRDFYKALGIKTDAIRIRSHEADELAHYSQQCNDIEYSFPFGWKELEGIAHRGTFDLSQHIHHSGKDLSVYDETTNQSYIPTVIESSVGVDRLFLAILCDAYREDTINGEPRIVLSLHPHVAPIKAAFFPLSKKLSDPMHRLFAQLKQKGYALQFDESGSIGKRYRRHDEIGTPLCFTYDFESAHDNSITMRDRDTTEQLRISIDSVEELLKKLID